MTSKTSDHDLIVRIDERQSNMMDKMTALNKKMDTMVPNDSEYQEIKFKVDNMWDSKNKMLGWMVGAGISGGGIGAILTGVIKQVAASWK